MRVETLLPLGKLDPGLRAAETPPDLRRVGEDAKLAEDLGYDGLAVEAPGIHRQAGCAMPPRGTPDATVPQIGR